jgi:hypothetical protein
MPCGTLRRLLLGEVILVGLAGSMAAIVGARRGAAWLGAEGARASALLTLVLVVATILALAPAGARAWRRARSAAFGESLAKYPHLPRWYVVLAFVMGAMADEAARRARGWAMAEAQSGSGWRTGMVAMALAGAHGAVWSSAQALFALVAAGVVAAMLGGFRYAPGEVP